jgi:arylsulfatase A-like enzyme
MKKIPDVPNTSGVVAAMVLVLLFVLACAGCASSGPADRSPNFIIIFCDDLGYGDVGVYGAPTIRTPNIDRMAGEGMRFTDFYAQPVCGPSRAALMTGCYPPRVSLAFNHLPKFETGLHPDEITIAELLKDQGYATAILGKWHLGDHPNFLPLRNGFDYYFGIPYSNDMWRFHPKMPPGDNPHPRLAAAMERAEMTGYAGQGEVFPADGGFPDPLPLFENDEVVEVDSDQTTFTRRFTEKALEFIDSHQDEPFLLYLAHVMPHVPLFAGNDFQGTSRRGLFGDAVEEIDWSVGQILDKLGELGIDESTLVLFTSDNGPWLAYGIDGGSAGPLAKGKGTPWEGGSRVPGIFRWPGKIPAGSVTSELATTMDLLPTFAGLAGAGPPADRKIDGHDIRPILFGEEGARSPHEALYYYGGDLFGTPGAPGPSPSAFELHLQAVRSGDWKLYLDEKTLTGTALYHLGHDVGEKQDVMERHPEVVGDLERMAREFNESLRKEVRPLGRLSEQEARAWRGE